MQSSFIDSAVTEFGDYVVNFLTTYDAIFKKASIHVSGAKGSCLMKKISQKCPVRVLLKGQSHKIFNPRFFSLNCTPGSPDSPDSWAKTVCI
jgi:hypothetical protein